MAAVAAAAVAVLGCMAAILASLGHHFPPRDYKGAAATSSALQQKVAAAVKDTVAAAVTPFAAVAAAPASVAAVAAAAVAAAAVAAAA